jgi:hypothetical protein
MNLVKPPLPPNKPYRQPLNCPKYVRDFDTNAHVRVFKVVIKENGETNDEKIVNLFSFTLKDTMSNWCKNTGDYLDCIFAKLQLAFCKRFKKVHNDEQVYM